MQTIVTEPLRGRHIELIPLELAFAGELAAAADDDRNSYSFTEVPDGVGEMRAYIENILRQRDDGSNVPYAQRLVASGRLVGCTRFLEVRRWFGRPEPDEVEIGGTWLSAAVQRTPVNTEAKLLLLTNAFETWQVKRVALCTDERNTRSRTAIERIGASFEGILRHHRPSKVAGEDGQLRDTAMYAITDHGWPAAKASLVERLDSRRADDSTPARE